ncbi:DUF362 domain-containing protein [Caldisalinibacter kiritimatiensis]|uniref:Iron-sulfur cluster-binding protein n=1 Tax=Caldisalinibacter kiritimatiensis TaxID=1304284 RepID=R1CSJ1_9FIRM|nr:DUF362 domain-containing protein [Caldisalinibacter kiritimatiensis]EOD01626.1 Iron-sulfur cluster-binding protein [Caldisalinibacter kiritimatiensis]
MRNRRVMEPIVSITENVKESKSLEQCLNNLPMERIIKQGDRVVITPNWVKAKQPNTGTVVGPDTLDKLIKIIKKYKPQEIIVATGSGGDATDVVMQYVGYDKVIKDNNVKFIDLNYGPYIELELNHNIPAKTKMNELYNNMDVLMSFTQLKMHEEATMSAGLKNIALGWPPAEIHGFPKKDLGIHEDLHNFIVAMAEKFPIDLTIISADKAMIGTGPSDGKAVDTPGLIIAGTDPVACDTVGARLLGFLPQAVHYLYEAYKRGIGEAELKNVQLKGVTLADAENIFTTRAYDYTVSLDSNGIKGFHGNK